MKHPACTIALLVLLCSPNRAAELTAASSCCLTPGVTTEITLMGSDLVVENDEDPLLWTSFAAQVEIVPPEKRERNRVVFRITPGADVRPGFAAIRAYNSQGVSHPLFFWIDRLPEIKCESKSTIQDAQPLSLPAKVVGSTLDRRPLFFRFEAQAGQLLSAEVIAQRVGMDMDAVLALLDENGRELISADDDQVVGSDCRFSLRIPESGTYHLTVNDLQYRGGRPFLLRVGEFPLVANVYPLGVAAGTTCEHEVMDIGCKETRQSTTTFAEQTRVGIHLVGVSQDDLSTARVFVSPLAQHLESEPNDDPAGANTITVPAGVNGRFLQRGDVDYYRFSAKQGQQLAISPVTRSVNSPSFVRMKLFGDDGNVVSDSRESGIDEALLWVRCPRDGEYLLAVSDILHGNGPNYGYHVSLEVRRAPFSLSAPYDKKTPRHRPVAVPGGVLFVPLKVDRHDYQGPIQLSAVGPGGALEVAGELIPEKHNDAGLRIRIPTSVQPTSLMEVVVKAQANIEGVEYSTTLDVASLIKRDFPQLPSLPPIVGHAITAAIIPPTFSGKAESVTVVRGAKVEVPVSVEWLSPRREEISLIPSNLPPDCRAEGVKNLTDKNPSTTFTLATTDKTPAGTYEKVFVDAIGRMHGEEFRIELPLTVTVTEKETDNAK